nr:InlB B-repeat-containing protein [Allomuricauda sp.]
MNIKFFGYLMISVLLLSSCKDDDAVTSHEVVFNSEGGSSVSEQEVVDGKTATEPEDPTREGFSFGGWYTDDTYANTFAFSTAISEDTELYAKWLDIYTVIFDTGGGNTVSDQEVVDGGTATEPEDPTREGFSFGGWYTDADFSGEAFDFETPITTDEKLYAKWEENITSHTVIFDTGGGSAVSGQEIEDGGTATEPEDPTRDGFSFGGWYTDDTYGAAFAFSTAISEDTELYAKWLDIYTVIFDTGGGSAVDGQEVVDGRAATEPEDPTRDGFSFGGWYTDDTYGTAFAFSTAISEDTELYAKWEVDSTTHQELQVASGNLESYLTNLINAMPGSSGDNYQLPTDAQRTQWDTLLTLMLQDNIDGAVTMAAELNYQITEFTDDGLSIPQVFYVLEEYNVQENYWGTYVFRKETDAENFVVMAPHVKYDTNTGFQAAYIYRNTMARALMISGTHRCNSSQTSSCSGTTSACGVSGAFKISDLAHHTGSVFQWTTENLGTALPDLTFVQLHGFSKGTTDPDIIMSNGTNQLPEVDYAAMIRDALLVEDDELTFKIAHIDTDWTRLRGFTNTQGRFLNGGDNPCNTSASETTGRFIHIEQSYDKLRKDATGWAKMSNALNSIFQ